MPVSLDQWLCASFREARPHVRLYILRICNVELTLNEAFAYTSILGTFYALFMAVFMPKLLAASGLLVARRTASVCGVLSF